MVRIVILQPADHDSRLTLRRVRNKGPTQRRERESGAPVSDPVTPSSIDSVSLEVFCCRDRVFIPRDKYSLKQDSTRSKVMTSVSAVQENRLQWDVEGQLAKTKLTEPTKPLDPDDIASVLNSVLRKTTSTQSAPPHCTNPNPTGDNSSHLIPNNHPPTRTEAQYAGTTHLRMSHLFVRRLPPSRPAEQSRRAAYNKVADVLPALPAFDHLPDSEPHAAALIHLSGGSERASLRERNAYAVPTAAQQSKVAERQAVANGLNSAWNAPGMPIGIWKQRVQLSTLAARRFAGGMGMCRKGSESSQEVLRVYHDELVRLGEQRQNG
ncbi:hypothetical protein K491DRAFT_676606 [Lophiostoma macrostomum CBS 122681]|uniref:Uncharacterized protein n=1 Tax=Lophiostoma macrostomum CBS 122681 TaxID=1314788 RepID=A0A6A6TE95_9PLEO|nr:hypothetical protein K491DRAFT_676606 [Lophiostoma macrostomum CBS 122681]